MSKQAFNANSRTPPQAQPQALLQAQAQALSRRQFMLGNVVAAMAVPLAGCAGGAELFVPFFVFTFNGTTGGQSVSFFLDPEPASVCKENGRFQFSRVTVSDGVTSTQYDVAGTFSGRDLSLTITNPPALLATAYDGHFIDDATITLTRSGGGSPFNVTRTGARAASCPATG